MKTIQQQFEEVFNDAERQAAEDFERGVKDCEAGKRHENQSAAYNEGYAFQYAYEQAKGASYD